MVRTLKNSLIIGTLVAVGAVGCGDETLGDGQKAPRMEMEPTLKTERPANEESPDETAASAGEKNRGKAGQRSAETKRASSPTDAPSADPARKPGRVAIGDSLGGASTSLLNSADGAEAAPKVVYRDREKVVYRDSTKGVTRSRKAKKVASNGLLGLRSVPAPSVVYTERPPEPPPPAGVTGGTFESAGVNPVVRSDKDRFSTFAVDVDTGSYHYSKSVIERGTLPPAASVRLEEWVNAFHYTYDDDADEPFAVHMAAAPSVLTKGKHMFRVGVQGKRLDNSERKRVHLTFLVDVSGSMSRSNKLPLAKKAMKELVKNLRDDDRVAIVTYAGQTGEVLPTTAADDKRKIFAAIDNMRSSGGTNMDSGMALAFRNAGKHLGDDVAARVVVLSDGDANIGRTSHSEILKSIRGYVSEGVTLSTVGFGHGNYNDHLMEQLADAGNGNYSYIDSEDTARRVFGTDLVQNLQVIAQDVKIQVEFHPDSVDDYRLLGYENRDIADKDFRNDKKDAGEIGAGHTVTALYEISLNKNADRDEALATVRIRHKKPRGMKATEIEQVFAVSEIKRRYRQLDADTQFAGAVALAAEHLRQSPYAPKGALDKAVKLAGLALGKAHRAERQEFVQLLKKAQNARGPLTSGGHDLDGRRGESGYFTLRTTPWAKIFVDGQPKGSTPVFKMKLSPGKHKVRLVNQGAGLDMRKTITIRPGKNLKTNWKLQ